MVQKVALRFQIVGARNIDGERALEEGEKFFVNGGQQLIAL
jgi:hypothetical protein